MMTPLWLVWWHPSLFSVFWSVVCRYRDVVAAGAAYTDLVDDASDETVREPTKIATTRLTTRVSTDFLMRPTSLANTWRRNRRRRTSCQSGLGRAPRLRSGAPILCAHDCGVQGRAVIRRTATLDKRDHLLLCQRHALARAGDQEHGSWTATMSTVRDCGQSSGVYGHGQARSLSSSAKAASPGSAPHPSNSWAVDAAGHVRHAPPRPSRCMWCYRARVVSATAVTEPDLLSLLGFLPLTLTAQPQGLHRGRRVVVRHRQVPFDLPVQLGHTVAPAAHRHDREAAAPEVRDQVLQRKGGVAARHQLVLPTVAAVNSSSSVGRSVKSWPT